MFKIAKTTTAFITMTLNTRPRTSQMFEITTAKFICIPTVIKNSPKSKSLKGIRSTSIWCLYCVSAIIIPAKNAPKEYEKPKK